MKKFEGADYNEASWRARVGEQLDWMLGSKGNWMYEQLCKS